MKKLLLIASFFCFFNAGAQFRLVKDISSGTSSSQPNSFFEYNGRLFFAATQSGVRSIFATDGTNAGTVLIRLNDPNTGEVLWNPNATIGFNIFNSELYFDFKSASSGFAYIGKVANASNAATEVLSLTNLVSSNNSRFIGATKIGDKVIFNPIATNNTDGIEPYYLDLTMPLNSGVLKNINPGIATNSNPSNFTFFDSSIFFSAFDPTNGTEIWKTDGTNAGTLLFLDLATGVSDSDPNQFNEILPTGSLSTVLSFVASRSSQGRELYKSNGTLGNVSIIKDINPFGDSNPTSVTKIDGLLYFAANNVTNGEEIWVSDGVTAGTVMIKDINTTGSSFPRLFTKVSSSVFFVADDGVNGNELWKTDGTNAGTVLVKDITVGVSSTTFYEAVSYSNNLYFTISDGGGGKHLWKSDGTASGTIQIPTSFSGLGNSLENLHVFNNELFFKSRTSSNIGVELCAYKDPALSSNDFQLNEKLISLYPNPSKTYFELTGEISIENVEIYSLQGQLVKSFKNDSQYTISDLAKGMYIVKINATEGTLNKTLIVE